MENNVELKTALQDCWKQIEVIYKQGRMCSERHLQAEMFHVLRQHATFEVLPYRIFVEPCIRFKNPSATVIPDMIFTYGDQIVGVMEIKYVPHGFPIFEKDFNSLGQFYKQRATASPFNLETDFQTGQWSKKEFKVAPNLLLIYCVIANYEAHIVSENENVKKVWKKLIGQDQTFENCLQLSGVVSKSNVGFHSTFLSETKGY
ncbi:hypothetical protein [Runella sp.]|uniref:hypothetical protein n=1 Tax=Runella sp. TaxID=1960881 RepID=UPI003D14B4FB